MLPFCSHACHGATRHALNMQNDAREFVDLYLPQKYSASNCIIGAKDHVSVQVNLAEVNKVSTTAARERKFNRELKPNISQNSNGVRNHLGSHHSEWRKSY